MEGVWAVYFPCILQAHTCLKYAVAKMSPLAKKGRACHSLMPKTESHMILASTVSEPVLWQTPKASTFPSWLGSKAEVVQLCPECGKDTCCSQYAHWWWEWSGTFGVFKILVEQGYFNFTTRFENFKYFFLFCDRITSPAVRTKICGWGPCSWGSMCAATWGSVIKLQTATQLLLCEWDL